MLVELLHPSIPVNILSLDMRAETAPTHISNHYLDRTPQVQRQNTCPRWARTTNLESMPASKNSGKKRMHDQCREGWVKCEVSKVRACLALFAPANKKGVCIFTRVLICGAHWGAHATFPSPGRCGLVPPVHSARWGKTLLIPRAQCAPHNAPPAQHARTTGTTRRTNSSRACPSGQHCDLVVFQRRWLCQTTRGQCVGLKSQRWALSQCNGGYQQHLC